MARPDPRSNPPIIRLAVVALSVWYLALAAEPVLNAVLTAEPAPGRITLRAEHRPTPGETPSPGAGRLWIESLVVDGRRIGLDTLSRREGWTPEPRKGTGTPVNLYSSAPVVTLEAQGSRLLLTAQADQWSGILELTGDAGPQVRELVTPPGAERLHLVEDPVARSPRFTFAAAFILLGLLAWRFAPIRGAERGGAWVVLVLSLLHLLYWASNLVGTTNDSIGYVYDVGMIVRHGAPSYFPPGYPLFTGLVDLVTPSGPGRWIVLLQHAMAVAAGYWMYQLLRRLLRDDFALLGGLAAGALSPVLALSHSVMSELPTLFAMVGALFLGLRSTETGRMSLAIAAGLLAGWAGLLRAVPLAALLPSLALVQIFPFWGPGVRRFAASAGTALAMTLLAVAWFGLRTGQPHLANSTGLHLFNRLVTEQRQLDRSGPATRRLLAMIHPVDPRGLPHWTVREQPGIDTLPYADQVRLLGDVAWEGIRQDPFRYLWYTPGLAWRELVAEPAAAAWGNAVVIDPRIEAPPPLGPTVATMEWRWRVERWFRDLWPVLCWVALAGLLLAILNRQWILALALAWVPAGYLLAGSAVDSFAERYNVPIIPFVVALALVPPSLIASAAGRVSPLSPRRRALPAQAPEPSGTGFASRS